MMKNFRNVSLLTAAASLSFAGAAHAGSVTIDALGGPIVLNSGPLTSTFSGAIEPEFTKEELAVVHQSLHDSGVVTNGFVTFILADTSDGLGFFTLIDDQFSSGTARDESRLGMSSTGPAHLNYWINDMTREDYVMTDNFGISQTADAEFFWLDQIAGDAFTWTNLQPGDGVTYNFLDVSGAALNNQNPFQFVTWSGNDWEVVDHGDFTNNGQFAFSFTVVPLPAPALMGLAGLAGIAIVKRRRKNAK